MSEVRPINTVLDFATGEQIEVPVSDAEWDDLKRRQAEAAAAQAARQAAEAAKATELASDETERQTNTVTAEDINAVTDLDGLKVIVRKQNRLIRQLLKRMKALEDRFPDETLG